MSNPEAGPSRGGAGSSGSRYTRSSGPVLDLELTFPKMKTYQPPTQLPTVASVVGMLRYFTDRSRCGAGRTRQMGIHEVAKQIYAKWYHDSVPCIGLMTLRRRLDDLLKLVQEGHHRYQQLKKGGMGKKKVAEYMELVSKKDQLYDIFPRKPDGEEDGVKKRKVEEEWGVRMGRMEELYYEDQKSGRRMECGKQVDPVWYQAMMKKQRERERLEAYREERDRQFLYHPLSHIEGILREDGSLSSTGDISEEEEGNVAKKARTEDVDETERETPIDEEKEKVSDALEETEELEVTTRTKKKFVEVEGDEIDPLPEKYRHIRKSERKVKDEVFIAIGNMVGEGLSLDESAKAIVEVGNVMFERKWKVPREGDETFDVNTLPAKSNIREALKQQEAQDLDLMVDELERGKEEQRPLTHFTDSTTKKGVGKFAAQGIHIGRDAPYPLPILPIDRETTEDVAMQVSMGLSMVAVVRGVTSDEIYKMVDTHMTDATEHNKGLAEVLQEMYDLDRPAGQLFCSSHTTLGMASAMNKVMRVLEAEMGLDKLVQSFMVDLDVDSKNSSVAGQALDMCLKLVAPEYSAKPWNKYKEFLMFLEERGAKDVLFSYKDSRFGCLSRAAAVLLYHWPHLCEFLAVNPSINNRLACLVREVMELSYLKPVLAVFACLGVHLVEPFYAHTISPHATHSKLKVFYTKLYRSMDTKEVSEDLFTFNKPMLDGVEEDLLEGVKLSYKKEVLGAVTKVAQEHREEVVKLASVMLPHLRIVLARQRQDYGIDEERFPARYPVEEQAASIDETPVTNLAAERACGKIDYRLHKARSLSAVSRQMILQRCKELRSSQTPSFRGYREAAMAKRELELRWTNFMKDRMKQGSDEKRELSLLQERKKLDSLEKLKEDGGPFTSAEEVVTFLADLTDHNTKEKQRRMKREIQYARDTSTLLPKTDPLFKIRRTDVHGNQRDKTALEFGEALKVFLGRKGDRQKLDYTTFKECLEKLMVP